MALVTSFGAANASGAFFVRGYVTWSNWFHSSVCIL